MDGKNLGKSQSKMDDDRGYAHEWKPPSRSKYLQCVNNGRNLRGYEKKHVLGGFHTFFGGVDARRKPPRDALDPAPIEVVFLFTPWLGTTQMLVIDRGFLDWGYPRMDCLQWAQSKMDDDWGYPYFRKPPFFDPQKCRSQPLPGMDQAHDKLGIQDF